MQNVVVENLMLYMHLLTFQHKRFKNNPNRRLETRKPFQLTYFTMKRSVKTMIPRPTITTGITAMITMTIMAVIRTTAAVTVMKTDLINLSPQTPRPRRKAQSRQKAQLRRKAQPQQKEQPRRKEQLRRDDQSRRTNLVGNGAASKLVAVMLKTTILLITNPENVNTTNPRVAARAMIPTTNSAQKDNELPEPPQ